MTASALIVGGALCVSQLPINTTDMPAIGPLTRPTDLDPSDLRNASNEGGPSRSDAGPARFSGVLHDLAQRLLDGPDGPSAEQTRVAREFEALYAEWDLRRFESMFARAQAPHVMEERIEWFRERLGECSSGTLMKKRDELRARYVYECAKGRLEVEFSLDEKTGKLAGIAMGARGIDPIDTVRDAADEALLLTALWSDQRFLQIFSESFELAELKVFFAEVRVKFGACRRSGTHLVSARGALFNVTCERGERLLKLELNDEDKIRLFTLTPPLPAEG